MTPLASPYTLHTRHTHDCRSACTDLRAHIPRCIFQPRWNPSHLLTTSVKQHTVTTFTHGCHAPQLPLMSCTQTLLQCHAHYSVSGLISKVICKTDRERAFPLSSDSHQRHQTLSPAEAQLCSTDSPG